MYSGDYYQLMAHYNHWMNEKIYAQCASLGDSIRKEDRRAFFKSIHSTLNHLLAADKIWMGRFTSEPYQAVMGQDLYDSFEELHAERVRIDLKILEWSADLEQEWLNGPFTFVSGIDGKTRTLPAWVLVTQMFNHQTHHRGQLSTLLTQNGLDPGITDIPWLPVLNGISS